MACLSKCPSSQFSRMSTDRTIMCFIICFVLQHECCLGSANFDRSYQFVVVGSVLSRNTNCSICFHIDMTNRMDATKSNRASSMRRPSQNPQWKAACRCRCREWKTRLTWNNFGSSKRAHNGQIQSSSGPTSRLRRSRAASTSGLRASVLKTN